MNQVVTETTNTVGHSFGGPVNLTTLNWNGDFIALVCGNFSLPAPAGGPIPTIRGVKFDDANRNGVRDGGEGGVGGITFRLVRATSYYHDQDLGEVATTQSGPDGSFAFALDGMGPGAYRVEEIAQSGWVATSPLAQTVIVNPGAGAASFDVAFGNRRQHPPVADAGPAQTVDQTGPDGASVTLDGSRSHDQDGDELAYAWTGPFGTATGERPTVQLPPGTWQVTLTVSDGLASDTATTSVTVYPPITVTGKDISSLEGLPFDGVVATFTDPDPDGHADEYAASVDWGDGTPASSGSIAKGSDGTFTVTGSHVYAEEGVAHPTVTVADTHNAFNSDDATSTATVKDAPLTASGMELLSTNPVDGALATFTDANPGAPLSDFTATVDWGDGTPASAGVVSRPTDGPFTVSGSHTYATLGPKTITVHIDDEGGETATATTHVLLYALSSGGNFVIGDRNAAVGTAVTFWGAQWWKLNTLSAGPAPAAFKGFENDPSGSTTLTGWSTDPGNSSEPPTSVPSYLAVIVSSSVTQNGSTISGDAPHVVIVRTDPGYAADPGHAGTGRVVATLR